jgi:hypothetical protein
VAAIKESLTGIRRPISKSLYQCGPRVRDPRVYLWVFERFG